MAGQDMSKNLGGMLSQTADTLGTMGSSYSDSLVRNIENMSRPDVDPTNLDQLTALQTWQSKLGRDEAARTTAAQMEGLKAEQTKAAELKAAKQQGQIRNNMDIIARDQYMTDDQKEIRLTALQTQLDALSATEQAAMANSGYMTETLQAAAAEKEAETRLQLAKDADKRHQDSADALAKEQERVEDERRLLNSLATAESPEARQALIRGNSDHAAALVEYNGVLDRNDLADAEMREYRALATTGPDTARIESILGDTELDEEGERLKATVERTGALYKNGSWGDSTPVTNRENHLKAVEALSDYLKQGRIADLQFQREVEQQLTVAGIEIKSQLDAPPVSAVDAKMEMAAASLGLGSLDKLDEEEYTEVREKAESLASIDLNRNAYQQLANLRIQVDPSKVKPSELPEGTTLSEFEEFRRSWIIAQGGEEEGGQESTLKAFEEVVESMSQEASEVEAPVQSSWQMEGSLGRMLGPNQSGYSLVKETFFDPMQQKYDSYLENMRRKWEQNQGR